MSEGPLNEGTLLLLLVLPKQLQSDLICVHEEHFESLKRNLVILPVQSNNLASLQILRYLRLFDLLLHFHRADSCPSKVCGTCLSLLVHRNNACIHFLNIRHGLLLSHNSKHREFKFTKRHNGDIQYFPGRVSWEYPSEWLFSFYL